MKKKACTNCGAASGAPFRGETFRVSYEGKSIDVRGLSGWRCSECGDVLFGAKSAMIYGAAGDKLVLESREAKRVEIRRIRKKLGLSQSMAAKLTGGGHNAISRYERGEATPVAAVVNLFKILDKHPELLKELT